MEQQTQKSTKAKVDAANAEMPEFMLTKTGVVLLGADLLGDKLAALVCEMLKDRNDSGVWRMLIVMLPLSTWNIAGIVPAPWLPRVRRSSASWPSSGSTSCPR